MLLILLIVISGPLLSSQGMLMPSNKLSFDMGGYVTRWVGDESHQQQQQHHQYQQQHQHQQQLQQQQQQGRRQHKPAVPSNAEQQNPKASGQRNHQRQVSSGSPDFSKSNYFLYGENNAHQLFKPIVVPSFGLESSSHGHNSKLEKEFGNRFLLSKALTGIRRRNSKPKTNNSGYRTPNTGVHYRTRGSLLDERVLNNKIDSAMRSYNKIVKLIQENPDFLNYFEKENGGFKNNVLKGYYETKLKSTPKADVLHKDVLNLMGNNISKNESLIIEEVLRLLQQRLLSEMYQISHYVNDSGNADLPIFKSIVNDSQKFSPSKLRKVLKNELNLLMPEFDQMNKIHNPLLAPSSENSKLEDDSQIAFSMSNFSVSNDTNFLKDVEKLLINIHTTNGTGENLLRFLNSNFIPQHGEMVNLTASVSGDERFPNKILLKLDENPNISFMIEALVQSVNSDPDKFIKEDRSARKQLKFGHTGFEKDNISGDNYKWLPNDFKSIMSDYRHKQTQSSLEEEQIDDLEMPKNVKILSNNSPLNTGSSLQGTTLEDGEDRGNAGEWSWQSFKIDQSNGIKLNEMQQPGKIKIFEKNEQPKIVSPLQGTTLENQPQKENSEKWAWPTFVIDEPTVKIQEVERIEIAPETDQSRIGGRLLEESTLEEGRLKEPTLEKGKGGKENDEKWAWKSWLKKPPPKGDELHQQSRGRRSLQDSSMHAEEDCHAGNLRACGQPALKKLQKETDMKTRCAVREEFLNCMGERRHLPCPTDQDERTSQPEGADPKLNQLRNKLKKHLATNCFVGYTKPDDSATVKPSHSLNL